MKRVFAFGGVILMMLALTACVSMISNGQTSVEKESIAKETMGKSKKSEDENMIRSNNKVLVVYFSNTGNTEALAKYAAEILDGEIFELVPQEPYSAGDLNYHDSASRATMEQNDVNARPAISTKIENINAYDVVVLGYPIWWGQAPRIISTFLESYDFSGKTIVPFGTSHSSDIGSSDEALHSLCSEKARWADGKRFAGGSDKSAMEEWLKSLYILFDEHSAKEGDDVTRVFNMETKTVMLNSGYKMPINGLGTYSLLGEKCVNSVTEALNRGVRLIDTAYMYHNEADVGKAVRNSSIPREEIFVMTKLYPTQFADAKAAIDEALAKMDIGYIDMMLLHHPGDGDVEAYKAMEQAIAEGKVRSIGLSNWYIEELQEFLPQIFITPALVQNEIHPYYQESDVIDYIHSLGIAVQGWYPLGGRGYTAALLGNEVISEIAKVHDVTSAQVILRWNLQKGVIVIPGSSNPEHIQKNMELYDFKLTNEEMKRMNALNRDEKHDWY